MLTLEILLLEMSNDYKEDSYEVNILSIYEIWQVSAFSVFKFLNLSLGYLLN